MNVTQFRKALYQTLPDAKQSRSGVRAIIRNRHDLNTLHSLLGMSRSAARVVGVLSPFITGAKQMTPELQEAARPHLGTLGAYIVMASRELKIKIPSFDKKIKLPTTISENLLQMVDTASSILGPLVDNVLQGKAIDVEAVSVSVKDITNLYYAVTTQFYGTGPGPLLNEYLTSLGPLEMMEGAQEMAQTAVANAQSTVASTLPKKVAPPPKARKTAQKGLTNANA